MFRAASGARRPLWGGLRLPALVGQSDGLQATLRRLHVAGAFVFCALILTHLAAALFHALVRRDGVFEAMAGGTPPAETAPAPAPAESRQRSRPRHGQATSHAVRRQG